MPFLCLDAPVGSLLPVAAKTLAVHLVNLTSSLCRKRKISLTYVDPIEFLSAHFLDKTKERLARSKVLLPRRREFQSIDKFRPGIESQQQFFIRELRAAVLVAHFFQSWLRILAFLDLARAWPIQDLGFHRLVHVIAAFPAPQSQGVLDHLVRHLFVSLIQHHVDRRLAADELSERRHHDRVTKLGAHLGGLFKNFLQLILLPHELQLVAQIGNHATGYLMAVPSLIVFARHANRQSFALCNFTEMVARRRQDIDVDERLVTERAQVVHHVENRRL